MLPRPTVFFFIPGSSLVRGLAISRSLSGAVRRVIVILFFYSPHFFRMSIDEAARILPKMTQLVLPSPYSNFLRFCPAALVGYLEGPSQCPLFDHRLLSSLLTLFFRCPSHSQIFPHDSCRATSCFLDGFFLDLLNRHEEPFPLDL